MDLFLAILSWSLFGLVIGALARLVVPGTQSMGILATACLGIAGSFIGGLVGYFLVGGQPLQASGWIGSFLGAVILLALATMSSRRGRAA